MHATKARPDWLFLLLFSTGAALLATLWGYNYSAGNAEEQLPFLLRALDPSFLVNDFFTNTFEQFGPRTFYTNFVAFFANKIPLTITLFVLTLAANTAIAFLSGLVSRHFFTRSRFSHFLAAAGVLTLKTFWLGYSNVLYRNFLEPEHLAMPFILLGVYLVLKRKPFVAALAFGVSAFFHALLGLEYGWIILGLVFVEWIIQRIRKESVTTPLKSLLASLLVMAVFSVFLLVPYTKQTSIPAAEFIHLVAYVRHPHHYLPSTFGLVQYGQAFVYLLGFALTFSIMVKRSNVLYQNRRYLYLIGGVIVLLCLGGYLFVEVWPSRLWTSAQMFRLPFIIKWFSIVLLGGWAGDMIEFPASEQSRRFGFVAAMSLVTPISITLASGLALAYEKLQTRMDIKKNRIFEVFSFLSVMAAVVLYHPELRTWICYAILLVSILFFYRLRWSGGGLAVSIALPVCTSALLILFATVLRAPSFLKYDLPTLKLYKTSGEVAELANYVKENTPEDAVFYVPPRFGEFRYMAGRAVVVDFAAYPFQDQAMREWFNRIASCYGVPDQNGFNALPQLNETIYHISDIELFDLSRKYRFTYAVVYDSTPTNFPLVFRTNTLKLVYMTNAVNE